MSVGSFRLNVRMESKRFFSVKMPSPVLEPRPGVRTEDDRVDVWPWNACLWRKTTGSCVATSSAISQIWRTCISWWRVCQSVGLVCSRWRPEVMHRCSSLLPSCTADESHAWSVVWYQPLLFFSFFFISISLMVIVRDVRSLHPLSLYIGLLTLIH